MANTATLPVPTNTQTARPAPLLPAMSAEAPDWRSTQRSILRDAPDGETAIRWQLAAALEHIAALETQLQAFRQLRVVTPTSWRPAILALLRERGAPMTGAAIRAALDAPRPLGDVLRKMHRAGMVTLEGGCYAVLLPAPVAVPAMAAPIRRGGRPRKQAP